MRSLDTAASLVNGVLEVLLKAGRALTQSGSVEEALETVADICASSIADYCSIGVVIEGLDRKEFAVSSGAHPDGPLPDACRLVLPLVAGRYRLGSIICLTREPNGFDDLGRRTLEVLATQLAVMVASHSAAVREHQVAERFQQALLPPTFPKLEGCEFHAVYRPSSSEAEVGGDWYDVFLLSDSRVAISIGDVAGHGLDAAVIMGEVRQALRTVAVRDGITPSEVLEYVNEVVRLRESIGMVTAIFGIYDVSNSLLTYATAGHPPPLFSLSNGLVATLPSAGLPLGCANRLESQNYFFTIPEFGRVAFYTDGLIENDRDLLLGEKALVDAIRSQEWSGDSDPAAGIATSIFGDAGNRDDAAVLVLTRRAPVSCYVFSATTVVSPVARAIVGRKLDELGVNEDQRFGALVALGEAVANAVEHAYRGSTPGLVRITVDRSVGHLTLTVEDFGRWRPFVRREERGRGIGLMHAFTDGVQIRSTRDSTAIVLRVDLAG